MTATNNAPGVKPTIAARISGEPWVTRAAQRAHRNTTTGLDISTTHDAMVLAIASGLSMGPAENLRTTSGAVSWTILPATSGTVAAMIPAPSVCPQSSIG